MITWNKPPLSIVDVCADTLGWRATSTVEQVEEAYAETFEVPYAILLPSARAGIDWAVRAAVPAGVPVLCPAFTCKVVHEAVVRSGRGLQILDATPGQFLLDPAAIAKAASGHHAIILSEMYGHTYDLAALSDSLRTPPVFRLLDMAMTVPSRALLARLAGSDFGVISFGVGKCLYAEWGGMGFTRDATLAAEVRQLRDRFRIEGGPTLALKRALRILLRVAISDPGVYRLPRRLHRLLSSPRRPRTPSVVDLSALWKPHREPMAWRLPSTAVDRRLIQRHLARSDWYAARRLALAAGYQASLRDVIGIILPPHSAHPLSHYTVRVHAAARNRIQSGLRRKGIAVGTLFEFPSYLRAEDFPNAAAIAAEVMNLPLSVDLSQGQLDHIVAGVAEAVAAEDCAGGA